jgi:hypothetical protein
VVVIETGIDVPQAYLSEAIHAIFRRELHCTTESVRSFLHIADYLQVRFPSTPRKKHALICTDGHTVHLRQCEMPQCRPKYHSRLSVTSDQQMSLPPMSGPPA